MNDEVRAYQREYRRRWRAANPGKTGDPAKARARERRWRAANPVQVREMVRANSARHEARYGAARRAREKAAVFAHYGEACACCGSTERLEMDHVNGDGAQHRARGIRGSALYRWLIKNNFPAGFQTLCRPCNKNKGQGERCTLTHNKSGTAAA